VLDLEYTRGGAVKGNPIHSSKDKSKVGRVVTLDRRWSIDVPALQ
jgi:hypothetical protein